MLAEKETCEKPWLGLGLWRAGLLSYGGSAVEALGQRTRARGGDTQTASVVTRWWRARLRWAALVARAAAEALDAAALGRGRRTARQVQMRCSARRRRSGLQRGRLGFGRQWIKTEERRRPRSEHTVKKGEIRFSRDDRTRWSHDRTW
jgi:hypothetical protein